MSKILLTEIQLAKLIETAMDLDIYSQEMETSSGDPNLSEEEAVEDIIDKLEEILYMMKSGKELTTNVKTSIFRIMDSIRNTYSELKYNI
jgi:hypothetical protein